MDRSFRLLLRLWMLLRLLWLTMVRRQGKVCGLTHGFCSCPVAVLSGWCREEGRKGGREGREEGKEEVFNPLSIRVGES